jgi:nickel/cobalt transporter (NicO) family protein
VSVSDDAAGPTVAPLDQPIGPRLATRLAVALAAVALVLAASALLAWTLGFAAAAPAVAPKNPFGTGLREAAPAATGIGGMILAVQSQFYRSLTAALLALKRDGSALWTLVGVGFLYGVFHAAGPGHGKGVIAGYLVASERTLVKGLGLSLAAALVQAVVAIGMVGILAAALKATAASINSAANAVELVSFAGVATFGAILLWRKAGRLVALARPGGATTAEACDPDCDHVHMPEPQALARLRGWRETAAVVLAAGIRPCSGAIIVLVFALSQGLFAAGIAAALAIALGTAITTGALASLAVFAKAAALRLAGGRGMAGEIAVAGLEVVAAAFILVLGAILLAGLWTSGLPS